MLTYVTFNQLSEISRKKNRRTKLKIVDTAGFCFQVIQKKKMVLLYHTGLLGGIACVLII